MEGLKKIYVGCTQIFFFKFYFLPRFCLSSDGGGGETKFG